jgi:hypothetical protein
MEIEDISKKNKRNISFIKMGKMYTVQSNSDGKIYVAVGPHWPGAVVTYCSVLFGTSLMVSLIGSIENKVIWSVFCIATTIISLCAQIFLLLTVMVNPGIVRKKHEEDNDGYGLLENPRRHFCDRCEVYQPSGCGHCDICDVCILNLGN